MPTQSETLMISKGLYPDVHDVLMRTVYIDTGMFHTLAPAP